MSAWIVSKEHVDLLVTAGLMFPQHGNLRWSTEPDTHKPTELERENATDAVRMLWLENFASVDHAYGDEDDRELPGADVTLPQIQRAVFRPINGTLDPVVVLKALQSYEYQSCEHPGWSKSQARRFCEALREAAIDRLPGYDEAPWGFDDRNYFTKAATV